ncbi:MAG: hypothetical protein HPY57_15480 [Ignavibacteria bacterium]|nr:hypothetical protein [Ignavibacteria bacterium]
MKIVENYVENFEYSFTKAEKFLDTPEGHKLLNKKKRLPKLERILK